MKKNITFTLQFLIVFFLQKSSFAQNIFSGEPVQVVGTFNGFSTVPYGTDYRTTAYRRITTTTGTPTDGRGQWKTTINVQSSGGDVMPINMPGGSAGGFLFISGPLNVRFNNKWAFSGVGQATLNNVNAISAYNSGENMGLNMSTAGYYTFIFNDCGYTQTGALFYVGYTSLSPVTINRNSQIINNDGSATIGITTSATPSSQENIFVRYTLGTDFSGAGSSSLVQATGSGTSYTATIPSQPNRTDVRYFLFTSTQTLSQLNAASGTNRNLSAMSVDDNAGNNFLLTTVLPVKISSFTGRKSSNINTLTWTTEVEINVNRYEIQRSADAVNFKTIAVQKANNMAVTNAYELNDSKPLENINYYRLIIVEKDGKENFSKIILLNNSKNDFAISVYPNPAVDKIQAAIPKELKGAYEVVIVNLSGQVLLSKKFNNNVTASSISIPLPKSFKKGIYNVKIVDENKTYNGSFLVL